MPHSESSGLINPRLTTRKQRFGHSADIVRRPIRPHVRRNIDGFVMPTASKEPVASKKIETQNQNPQLRVRQSPRSSHTIKPALPRQTRSQVLKRQPVQKKSKRQRIRVRQQRSYSRLLVSMACLIFVGGSVLSYIGWKSHQKTGEQVQVLASTSTNDEDIASEDQVAPDLLANYRVAPDMPRFIKIPRLNIDARVKRLGLDSNGILKSPGNVFDVGWYDGSSKPGENGTVLINGHVHGPTKPGIFYRLNNLKSGDTVDIERGDGEVFTYQVVTTESVDYDKVDMAKALTTVEPGKQGLNIITCTGRYDIKTNTYEQRLIVYLVQQ